MPKNLSNKEFKELQINDNVIILDVRTYGECCEGIIQGAKNIDVMNQDFLNKVKELPKDKEILVYCRSGNRSSLACSLIEKEGFKSVYNLGRGIMGWDGEIVDFN